MQSLLFTGASGFLGSNILPLLKTNYDVDTLALDANATYNINLVNDDVHLNKRYDIVLHAAGKAHVIPKTEEEIKLFYDINFEGTKKVCSALQQSGVPKSFIFTDVTFAEILSPSFLPFVEALHFKAIL